MYRGIAPWPTLLLAPLLTPCKTPMQAVVAGAPRGARLDKQGSTIRRGAKNELVMKKALLIFTKN